MSLSPVVTTPVIKSGFASHQPGKKLPKPQPPQPASLARQPLDTSPDYRISSSEDESSDTSNAEQDEEARRVAIMCSPQAHNTFKKLRLQHTFDIIATSVIIFMSGFLLYGNWLMLAPHITPIFWAYLFSIVLSKPLRYVVKFLHYADEKLAPYKFKLYFATLFIYLASLPVSTLFICVITSISFVAWTVLLFGDRSTVGTIILLLAVCVVLGLPCYYTITTCISEGVELSLKIQQFIEQNDKFQGLLEDFGTSRIYLAVKDYAGQWGIVIPEYNSKIIKEELIKYSMQMTSQFTQALSSVVVVLSGSVQLIIAFITFGSTLYYFLVHYDSLNAYMSDLSPFSDQDSTILMDSLTKSVQQIFISSMLVGVAHFTGTYIIFHLTNVDLTLILSVLAGLTSMLPMLCSYIIWIPVAIAKLIAGQHIHCLAITIIQLILQFPVDYAIYSIIPGNPFIIAFALAMGMYIFGFVGLLLGPLLAGLLVTAVNMYAVYQRFPRLKMMKQQPHELELDFQHISRTLSLTETILSSSNSSTNALQGVSTVPFNTTRQNSSHNHENNNNISTTGSNNSHINTSERNNTIVQDEFSIPKTIIPTFSITHAASAIIPDGNQTNIQSMLSPLLSSHHGVEHSPSTTLTSSSPSLGHILPHPPIPVPTTTGMTHTTTSPTALRPSRSADSPTPSLSLLGSSPPELSLTNRFSSPTIHPPLPQQPPQSIITATSATVPPASHFSILDENAPLPSTQDDDISPTTLLLPEPQQLESPLPSQYTPEMSEESRDTSDNQRHRLTMLFRHQDMPHAAPIDDSDDLLLLSDNVDQFSHSLSLEEESQRDHDSCAPRHQQHQQQQQLETSILNEVMVTTQMSLDDDI